MKYTIRLTDAQNHHFDLCYQLYDHRVAREWAILSQAALNKGATPAGVSLNFQVTHEDFDRVLSEMNKHLSTIRREEIISLEMPDLSRSNLSQQYLNIIHEKFHRYEEEVQANNVYARNQFSLAQSPLLFYKQQQLNLYTPTHYALGYLNTLIHWVENAYKMLDGTHINQFFNYYLHPNSFAPLKREDYELSRISLNFGDLMLGYGTTGKNLYHCYIDNDQEVIKQRLIRTQKTISTEILAFFPLRDADAAFEREQNERFRKWCEQVPVAQYGYNLDDPEHRIGHIPLGKLEKPLTLSEVKEVFGRYTKVNTCFFTAN